MSAYTKGNFTIVTENISYIQENVNGKNYVRLVDGTTIEITDTEVAAIKKLL